jgi:hypothetical protein
LPKRHSPGVLALFANVTTAIEAVERMSVKPEPATLQTAARAVVSDDGAAIRLTLYDDRRRRCDCRARPGPHNRAR